MLLYEEKALVKQKVPKARNQIYMELNKDIL